MNSIEIGMNTASWPGFIAHMFLSEACFSQFPVHQNFISDLSGYFSLSHLFERLIQ